MKPHRSSGARLHPVPAFLGLALFAACLGSAWAQNEPFLVHDTKPVVLHGPYITSISETSATIVWVTDTPCHAKVVFGEKEPLTREADNAARGLLPVGWRHAVTLTGLEPGRTYSYKAVSTRVVKLKAYWPEKGLSIETPAASFTTWDRTKPSVAFAALTDTHEDAAKTGPLLKLIDRTKIDFLVHLGDAFHSLESEDQLFNRWLDPASKFAAGSLPLLFLRGNHEARGAFARDLFDYIPTPEGRYYYARDHGPLHLIILDTGEDKADNTNVFARLNAMAAYRTEEFEWLRRHLADDPRVKSAPFRVILLHQPNWGWTNGQGRRWTELANRAGVDLVIGGHYHRLQAFAPGSQGNDFQILALGQEQVARVEATEKELQVTVTGKNSAVLQTIILPVKKRR